MNKAEITMLNFMADPDFIKSLDTQKEWGIHLLDLKDHIYGKALLDLTDEEAEDAAKEIAARGLEVYCFSSTLFFQDVELGEKAFLQDLEKLNRILELARILKPQVIRLLAASTSKRDELIDTLPYIQGNYPWLISVYQTAINRIHQAGFRATIENEANGCIWARPEEITGFYEALGCGDKVSLTFDIQNLWQMGTFPSAAVFNMLEDLTDYFHLKGSQSTIAGGNTVFGSTLEDSTWDVIGVTKMAINGKGKAVICLNPVKGKKLPDYSYENLTKRDLDYLRDQIKELQS